MSLRIARLCYVNYNSRKNNSNNNNVIVTVQCQSIPWRNFFKNLAR